MARVTRVRLITDPFPSGTVDWRNANGDTAHGEASTKDIASRRCADSKGRPITDSNLSIDRWDKSKLEVMNGSFGPTFSSTEPWAVISNYPYGRYATDYTAMQVGIGLESHSSLATKVLARTNPNRPKFVIGEMIKSIYETPRLLREIGGIIRSRQSVNASRTASDYLAIKFGWAPLFKDIYDTINVLDYISRRNQELQKLYSSSGLRRRCRLLRQTGQLTDTQFIASGFPASVTASRYVKSDWEVWGTVRWKPTVLTPFGMDELATWQKARRIVLGATASGAFASSWDLIPWTWMLNWCVNIRDFVLAHGNTIPCDHGKVNIMIRGTHKGEFKVTSKPDWLTGGDGTIMRYTKQRSVVNSASLETFLPHLDAGRLSILMALGLQRRKMLGL
ncbi:MAG: putative maturation protein [Alehxovirus pseudofaecenecus]|uniref:Maturation protein n=1 Tax=Leviviridae sp. TaxID=2027243 RepID=A0ABY3SV05_9VIRU|nr:MAG: putative maturation protein [Leviviridae sp.]